MEEMLSIPRADFQRMEARITKLAREKSYLQLVNNLMERLSAVPGLEKTVDTILSLIIDNFGGSNAILYYRIEGRLRIADAYGVQSETNDPDDPLVQGVFVTGTAAEEARPYADTRMTVPALAKAVHWAFPLRVGDSILGVLKLEDVLMSPEIGERLTPFLRYAALVLKNEIESFARLQDAYEELNAANEMLQDHVTALADRNTELSAAYRDLKETQSQLLQREKMASIGQLAAGVAHEINNPMGFILSNLGTLQRYSTKIVTFINELSLALAEVVTKDGEEARDIMERVAARKKTLKIDPILSDLDQLICESLEGGLRVKEIVQNLKNFSHIDATTQIASDINAGLESTLALLVNVLRSKATVVKEYGELPLLLCNAGQLNQVFMNLLINAAHSIANQGEIRIRTWCDGEAIMVSIADTGHGMTPEIRNRIFEPFFTTKEVGKGTGLGLSIAYDIVRKHHGTIDVVSAPGEGTTVVIRLPLARGEGT